MRSTLVRLVASIALLSLFCAAGQARAQTKAPAANAVGSLRVPPAIFHGVTFEPPREFRPEAGPAGPNDRPKGWWGRNWKKVVPVLVGGAVTGAASTPGG